MPVNFANQERLNLLNSLLRGRSNAITAPVLERTLSYSPTSNQTTLRKLIKECIEYDMDLIGASTGAPAGYFIIDTVAEFDVYLDTLEGRIRSNNVRRNALIAQWNSTNPATTRLPLTIT